MILRPRPKQTAGGVAYGKKKGDFLTEKRGFSYDEKRGFSYDVS